MESLSGRAPSMTEVQRQYENWVYPVPVEDLDRDAKDGVFDLSDPSLFRRKFWPRRTEPDDLTILVAGCGTSQAARLAYRNPQCQIVGIDLSKTSLAHQARLKDRHGLSNLRLENLPILQVEKLNLRFDLIVSTGVLHHLEDPDAGLRALRQVLLPHGVMSIMLYGLYPRFGVYMMQEAFRLLGLGQTAEDVALVRETVEALPSWHHVQTYVRTTPELKKHDAEVVDTFLHPCDRAYTVPQLLRFAADNGLRFQDWLDRFEYSLTVHLAKSHPAYPLAEQLPAEARWQFVELLGQRLACHRFLMCRPERDPEDYTVDFSGETDGKWLRYVPHRRWPFDLLRPADPSRGVIALYRRHTHEFTLAPREESLLALVDGRRSIADIVQASPLTDGPDEARAVARRFFARMHEVDHLLYEIP